MEPLRFQRHLSGTALAVLSDILTREKDKAGMNNSSDEKTGETMSPSGSAKRLEEVLDNLDLELLMIVIDDLGPPHKTTGKTVFAGMLANTAA